MRNLKRALSLLLSSTMVLGMVVMGGSAAGYQDVDASYNQEAIEVLQAVGIMTGVDDAGNFNPDATVTRNEMAVIMSNLMAYNVKTYSGTSPFTDVPEWAEPYVAACWTNGITAGTSATTYGGDETVTTAQAALMLMKALGYFQYQSDFGDDWQLATVKQANKIDLFNGVDSAVTAPMTRNDVAQLVLNTLKSGMVEADDDTIKVDTDGVTVEAGKVTYNYITSGEDYAGAIKGLTVAGTVVNSGTRIVELGEKLYQGNLKMTDNTTDNFGRPATRWTYKASEVGTYGDKPLATYTDKVSAGDLYALLGSASVNALDVVDALTSNGNNELIVYVDGAVVSSDSDSTSKYLDRNSSAGGYSGKGVLTEVYQDNDNNVTLVYTNTYVMQATDDYSASKGSVDVTVLTGNVTDNALNVDEFENIADVAENDYILYTAYHTASSPNNWSIANVSVAKVVSGDVTAYSNSTGRNAIDADPANNGATGSVTLDGTKYDYAKSAEVDNTNGCGVEFTVGVGASIVLDNYGYAIYVDDASLSVGNYVYISAIANETNLSTKVIADAYFTDGSNNTIVVKNIYASNETTDLAKQELTDQGETRADNAAIKGWYSYSKNSKDEYTLTKATNTAALSGTTIDQNKVSIAGTVSGNKDTIFIVLDKNDNINVYTGISNVPDITGITTANSYYLRDKDEAGKPASVVFVDASNGSVKNNNESLLYLLKLNSTSIDNTDNEKVYTWKVLLKGEETSIKTKQVWTKGVLYENYSIDADGYYEADNTDKFDTTNADKFYYSMTDKAISNSGDTLTIGGVSYVVGDNTNINLVMAPAVKGASDTLSGTIMTDNAADYETMLGITSRNLANKFKGYTVTGEYYVVYEDKSGSDLITDLYVVVTAANYNGIDTPILTDAKYEKDAGSVTDLNATVTVATGHSVAYQWQSSTDGTSWNNAGGSDTNATYTPAVSAAGVTYYRCKITETLDSDSSTVGVSYTNVAPITVAPVAPTWTDNTSEANVSGKTVTIKANAAFAQGTYKLYVGDATTAAAQVVVSDGSTQDLSFTGVEGLKTEATDFYITVTVNGVESAKSAAKSITPGA